MQDLTDVHSPALFDERAMQFGLSSGIAADLVMGWNLESKANPLRCSSQLGHEALHIVLGCVGFQQWRLDTTGVRSDDRARSRLLFAVSECSKKLQLETHFCL